MSFVVDASVAIAWAFNERHATAAHTRARIRAEAAIVPSLWWYEVRNVLVLGERQGRLTERKTARFLRGISRLAVAMDGSLMKARFSLSLANTGSPSMMPPILSGSAPSSAAGHLGCRARHRRPGRTGATDRHRYSLIDSPSAQVALCSRLPLSSIPAISPRQAFSRLPTDIEPDFANEDS
jgi:hypothetical protein